MIPHEVLTLDPANGIPEGLVLAGNMWTSWTRIRTLVGGRNGLY